MISFCTHLGHYPLTDCRVYFTDKTIQTCALILSNLTDCHTQGLVQRVVPVAKCVICFANFHINNALYVVHIC